MTPSWLMEADCVHGDDLALIPIAEDEIEPW